MTRLCKDCLQETPEENIAYRYTEKKYCLCRECQQKRWRTNNVKYKKPSSLTLADTDKYKVGETYSTRGMSVEQKQNVFMSAILYAQDAAEKINAEREV